MDTEASLPFSKDSIKRLVENSANNARPGLYKRSLSVAEVIRHPNNLEHPIPIALKVKNAGREFLKHDQTCQWIKFIQNKETEPPSNKRTVHPVKLFSSGSHNAPDKLSKQDVLKELIQTQQSTTLSYEERLKILQKQQEELLKRQHILEEQLEKQNKLQEPLLLEPAEEKVEKSDSSETKEPSTPTIQSSQYTKITRASPGFRRRLKGSVAQYCAERNEGSIGSLLYYTVPPCHLSETSDPFGEKPLEKSECLNDASVNRGGTSKDLSSTKGEIPAAYKDTSPVRAKHGANSKGTSPAAVGRQKAISQESGYAVSELLQHKPILNFDELNPSMFTVQVAGINRRGRPNHDMF